MSGYKFIRIKVQREDLVTERLNKEYEEGWRILAYGVSDNEYTFVLFK